MQIIIMSGLPGSGKSRYVQLLSGKTEVCSADDYFMVNGQYVFDANKLSLAHSYCLRKFIHCLRLDDGWIDNLVVDNTNTTALEIAPYVAIASAYGFKPTLVTIQCNPVVAFKRNTHGVALGPVEHMQHNLRTRVLPIYWDIECVDYEQ